MGAVPALRTLAVCQGSVRLGLDRKPPRQRLTQLKPSARPGRGLARFNPPRLELTHASLAALERYRKYVAWSRGCQGSKLERSMSSCTAPSVHPLDRPPGWGGRRRSLTCPAQRPACVCGSKLPAAGSAEAPHHGVTGPPSRSLDGSSLCQVDLGSGCRVGRGGFGK